MPTALILVLLSTLAGLISLWSEEFTDPLPRAKPDESGVQTTQRLTDRLKREKSRKIKAISTLFVFLTLSFTLYQSRTDKIAAASQHAKDSLAYNTLDSTYRNSIENGKAVNDIRTSAKLLVDSLDTVRGRIDRYAETQIDHLNTLSVQSSDILNPVPERILVEWYGKFTVKSTYAENWNNSLVTRDPAATGGHYYSLDDTLLYETRDPLDGFIAFDEIDVGFTHNKSSIRYSGNFKNYDLPVDRDDFAFNTTEYTHLLYDTVSHSVEFTGKAVLQLKDMTSDIQSWRSLPKFNIEFKSGFIYNCKASDSLKIGFNVLVSNKNEIYCRDVWYDSKEWAFKSPEKTIPK